MRCLVQVVCSNLQDFTLSVYTRSVDNAGDVTGVIIPFDYDMSSKKLPTPGPQNANRIGTIYAANLQAFTVRDTGRADGT